jgi:glucosamine-6-phosphate deaminase
MPPAMSSLPLTILPDEQRLGETLAALILDGITRAATEGRTYCLGLPTGRSPRPVYRSLVARLDREPRDLSHLHLFFMDEYLRPPDGRELVSLDEPWSCGYYIREEVVAPLASALPVEGRLRPEHVHLPDPHAPVGAYEAAIRQAGGIDLFLVATGGRDGHVAFNPPGTPLDSLTRRVRLAEGTRRDNLDTFPQFGGDVTRVPEWGMSVGLGTILDHSRAIAFVAHGEHKRDVLRRFFDVARFTAELPTTFLWAAPERVHLYLTADAVPENAPRGH